MTLDLHLSGLRVTYPGASAPTLDGVNLTVRAGSLTALLGPSGTGKTTVLKLVAGLLQPDAGDIRLGGQSILALPPERRKVVLVFQSPLLFPHLTVAENVGFGLRMRGLPRAVIAERAAAMLDRLHLTGLAARRPDALSGGQSQRVALARALILEPDLLLLDEPLSSLDPGLRDEMRGLIRTLQREIGVTTLVVTHDQTEAVVMADSIALLQAGRIAQDAAPEVIYARPASLAVARFFGGENFLHGHAANGVFHGPIGRLPLPPGSADGPGTLTLRPEAVILGPGPEAREARVVTRNFLGTQSRVELDLGGIRLVALVAPEAARGLADGQTVGVTLPQSALWMVPDVASPVENG